MRDANIIMRRGKTARDRFNAHDGVKTGHCPWSGKETEAGRGSAARAYLDALPSHRTRPPRNSTLRTTTPQQDSREAVQRQQEMRA